MPQASIPCILHLVVLGERISKASCILCVQFLLHASRMLRSVVKGVIA